MSARRRLWGLEMTFTLASAPLADGPLDRAFMRVPVRVLDRIEQALILGLWVLLLQRVLTNVFGTADLARISAEVRAGHLHWSDSWLLLLSETAVMIFVMLRRSTDAVSVRLGDWLLAVTATAAPLMIQPGYDMLPMLRPLGFALLLVGNVVQALAKLSLRRSFGIAPANRGVKADGLYRFVRHPMYAGYLLVHLGVMVLMPSPFNAVIYAIGWWAQILRLLAEEQLLGQDPAYRAYMDRQRWRLIPGVF